MTNPSDATLVIIPTYNELENLPLIVGRVRAATPEVDILVVDDNSPDGTGDKADELAAEDARINVLHRESKGGLCGAYVAGFQWGLEREYTVLCEMDADGSHAPEQLHLLLSEIDSGADLVIGSRYVPGGKVVNWPKKRWILSKGGNAYISFMLGGGLSDMTAGYRAYRREVLEAMDLDELSNAGYIFQVDLAWRRNDAVGQHARRLVDHHEQRAVQDLGFIEVAARLAHHAEVIERTRQRAVGSGLRAPRQCHRLAQRCFRLVQCALLVQHPADLGQ